MQTNTDWTTVPRDAWKAYQERKVEVPEKVVREFLRWQEEYWAMQECRSVGMRTMIYR